MFELDMSALRQTAKQPWLTANVANLANLANPIATPAKSDWLTVANVANPLANERLKQKQLATLASVSHRQINAVAIEPTKLATLASVSHRQINAVAIEPTKLATLATLATSQRPVQAANDGKPLAKLATLAGLAISHDLLTKRLMAAAMRRCDHFNDGEVAREAMRQDVLATPLHLQQDLLDYFNEINQKEKP